MDTLRAILMLLGIVIHSAQIYNPEQSWLIYSPNNDSIFQYVIQAIGSFRMPAFFIVSGYFSLLLMQKNIPLQFFVTRIDRLFVPLLVGVLTLNIPLAYLLKQNGWIEADFDNFLSDGGWKQHLWFLIYLFIYTGAAVFLYYFMRLRYLFSKLSDMVTGFNVLVTLFTIPFIFIFFQILNKLGIPVYEKFIGVTLFEILYYLPFFLLGMLLKYNSRFFTEFTSFRCFSMMLGVYFFLLFFKWSFVKDEHAMLSNVLSTYSDILLSLMLSALCFYIFSNFLNRQSVVFSKISEASYTVYIFHQPIVVLLGLIAIHYAMPIFIAFPLIVVFTFLLTLFIHFTLIHRFKFLAYFYNGKRF
jgi:glucan biosynthesis protein C